MALKRSYGRIIWKGKIIVFHMVNQSSQEFMIYDDSLFKLFDNRNRFARIKRKNNKASKSGGYYLGEIYGHLKEIPGNQKKKYLLLTLYIGQPYKTMRFETDDKSSEPLDIIEIQKYAFPKLEFERYVDCIRLMYDQEREFTMIRRKVDVMPFGEIVLLDDE